MKLVANRPILHTVFQHTGNIISSTIARPIYQNVKMEAVGDNVYLSATDLEVGLRLKVDGVQIEEEGTVLLPEARVSRILATTPDDTVLLAGDESKLGTNGSDNRVM